ncbi:MULTISPECIES: glycosyltransferase family 39 protein [unclassified Sinorhizobium]|uniref:ArnT family glycosyltransferase n=1 Tax=unclassified Sinorhizobium TaxID=2613772 RepID=UPI0024C33712|nr:MULTISPECIES: glycosyltransferase family 39 protein [unclassified Sinorhizobium]MDK1377734.1 glycosyltransferase family 39 protein [Sinorhizobium sp. 6-70]MDK1478694.1 glycosyltransferase family 39 protein [Sinorhizobium sp. 6-117]
MALPTWTRLVWLPLVVFILFLAAISFRPLLPIDETRYTSVAWEMYLRQEWLKPLTMNFVPYHHKLPLLFWLINASWSIFGVSRWAATLPVVLSSLASVYLTVALGRVLFPGFHNQGDRTAIIMVASVPFLVYSTLIYFDFTLTVFVLLSLIGTVAYARKRDWRSVVLIGVSLGLGILARGPVAFLHVLFPILLAPLWASDLRQPIRWYLGILAALGVAAVIVLCWLIPVLWQADGKFAYALLWVQTVGRATGKLDAHVQPFYFYLPFLPVALIPWIFLPRFWKGAAMLREGLWETEGMRFLICWVVPTFLLFSLISEKQPHYLLPLVPAVVLAMVLCLKEVPTRQMAHGVAIMVVAIVAGQIIASATILKRYDLEPVAAYMRANRDKDWAFIANYHAEVGFLARLEKPVDDVPPRQLAQWFTDHPDGRAIVICRDSKDVAGYKAVMDHPYRGKRMVVLSAQR